MTFCDTVSVNVVSGLSLGRGLKGIHTRVLCMGCSVGDGERKMSTSSDIQVTDRPGFPTVNRNSCLATWPPYSLCPTPVHFMGRLPRILEKTELKAEGLLTIVSHS